jgi:formate dehydrogenase subunit gamma
VGTCLLTAAFLYVPPLAELVGRRQIVVTVHKWAGILTPLPLLTSLASRAMRTDLHRLNRFGPHDRRWLAAAMRRRRREPLAGKFNAGQKVYANGIVGTMAVMLGTGLIMWFTQLAPLSWRIGAAFVHDWLALAVGGAVAAHIRKALKDPEASLGMRTGTVSYAWAIREHPLWRPRLQRTDPVAGEREARS